MIKVRKGFALTVLLGLTGCASDQVVDELHIDQVSPSTPPLASDVLQQLVSSCRAQVDDLWSKRTLVSQAGQKDFSIAMGRASRLCDLFQDYINELRKATEHEHRYQEALQQAQAILGGQRGGPSVPYEPAPAVETESSIQTVPLD